MARIGCNEIHLHNNIWSDPTGSMGDTFNRGNNTTNLTFDNNLFWNDGNPFPTSAESIIEVDDDQNRIVADPLPGDQTGLVLPHWNPGTGQFADGSTTIRQTFERLVQLCGIPAAGSPTIDAADPVYAPPEDILGRPRTQPDIGAVEFFPALSLSGRPADQTIYLGWTVNTTLPLNGDQSSPITGIISPTRFYTLTGLTNYTWYSVTLKAMLAGNPF